MIQLYSHVPHECHIIHSGPRANCIWCSDVRGLSLHIHFDASDMKGLSQLALLDLFRYCLSASVEHVHPTLGWHVDQALGI
jgi:hypothetical protein